MEGIDDRPSEPVSGGKTHYLGRAQVDLVHFGALESDALQVALFKTDLFQGCRSEVRSLEDATPECAAGEVRHPEIREVKLRILQHSIAQFGLSELNAGHTATGQHHSSQLGGFKLRVREVASVKTNVKHSCPAEDRGGQVDPRQPRLFEPEVGGDRPVQVGPVNLNPAETSIVNEGPQRTFARLQDGQDQGRFDRHLDIMAVTCREECGQLQQSLPVARFRQ